MLQVQACQTNGEHASLSLKRVVVFSAQALPYSCCWEAVANRIQFCSSDAQQFITFHVRKSESLTL